MKTGFLSIQRITTDAEIEWLKDIYNQLFNRRTGEKEGRYFDLAGPRAHSGRETLPQVLGPGSLVSRTQGNDLFPKRTVCSPPNCLGVESENVNGGGHMILKPARYGGETPWHQDEAYWNPEVIPHSLSVWLPLDPRPRWTAVACSSSPPLTKPMSDGTATSTNNPLVHGLITDDVDPSQAVACPIPAGGATFHHCRTLHYAGPNFDGHPATRLCPSVWRPTKSCGINRLTDPGRSRNVKRWLTHGFLRDIRYPSDLRAISESRRECAMPYRESEFLLQAVRGRNDLRINQLSE